MYSTCFLFAFVVVVVLLFILEAIKFFSLHFCTILQQCALLWVCLLTLCWALSGPFHLETHVFEYCGIILKDFINDFSPPYHSISLHSFALFATLIIQVLNLLGWSSSFLIFISYFSSLCSFALYAGLISLTLCSLFIFKF